MMEEVGVKLGFVDEHVSRKLINDHVVDQKTHMVSYPKIKVFLGEETMGEMPGNFRKADQMFAWFMKEFNFDQAG